MSVNIILLFLLCLIVSNIADGMKIGALFVEE